MSRAAAVELTALEHLRELWLRLMGSVIVMFVGGGIAYVFRLQIINFLQRPLNEKLYYTSPTGSFQFIMQVCLLCGVILSLPILIYNILRFVEPAFTKSFSRRFVLFVLGSSLTLTAGGVLFAYYLTLPFALKFFNSVGTSTLHPLISVDQYFSFILGYLATFAIVFQLPLLLLFINFIKPFKPGGLTHWRKYLYIGAFAVSIIMPSSPDPLSQISLAIPIITLYEVSVALIWAVNRKKRRADGRADQVRATQAARSAKLDALAHGTATRPIFDTAQSGSESFSITKQQEKMRMRAQPEVIMQPSQPKASVPAPTTPHPTRAASSVTRKNYQVQARRAPSVGRRTQFGGGGEPRLINDVI